ncbi:MAG: hypothetical protein RR495_06205 [Anaerovoracaceae bacterium]
MELDVRDALRNLFLDEKIDLDSIAEETGLSVLRLNSILDKNEELGSIEFLCMCKALNMAPSQIMEYAL